MSSLEDTRPAAGKGRLRADAAAASFGVAVLLSQVRLSEERRFPAEFGEVASGEHGHEAAADPTTDFFEGRELAGRLTWLFYALGVLLALRAVLREGRS